jgi:hypothetical protein
MNTPEPRSDSALVIMGGLVAEVDAPNLPPGAAAISTDMDYDVGSAFSRDGIAGVYTFEDGDETGVAQQGANGLQLATAWTNPDNIVTNTPGTYATVSLLSPNVVSRNLDATVFGFSIPADATILGIQVTVNGKQSNVFHPGAGVLSLQLLNPSATGNKHTGSLPLIDGSIVLGSFTDLWGLTLTPAEINLASFGVGIQASTPGDLCLFSISGVVMDVFWAPPGTGDFIYVKSMAMQNGGLLTLAFDDLGTWWQEDVINNPGVLEPFYSDIEPDTFAQSITYDGREWIALSDLQEATDMPRQYNGQWVDRVSQVGPGAPPTFTATTTTYPIVSITQAPAEGDPGNPGHLSDVLWSNGPNSSTAGNILTIYYKQVGAFPTPDPLLIVGQGVELSGLPNLNGIDVNGTYIITSLGQGVPPGGAASRWYFTVQTTSTQSVNMGAPGPTGQYQLTLATLTTSVPVPMLQVGSQFSVSGASVSGWDATWTALYTPNASQLQITATSLTSNVATYDYTLITGGTPTVGQQVSVQGTDNGNGIFNVQNKPITAVSPTSFSISLNSPNIAAAAETDAQAIVNGTIFQFDPGIQYAGSATNPIFGNSTGGSLTLPGNLGAGQRMGVCFFITRNEGITACSFPVTFSLTEGSNVLVVSNIPIGPPNVIARGIALTPAGGAFFYYIPDPVTITNPNTGVKTTYTSTVVNNNTASEAQFTFTDGVLLNSTEIDIQGNNLFEQIELGSCLGFIAFASRLFAWGEQNKVQNFVNLSFDGGYLSAQTFQLPFKTPSSAIVQPLGWTVDPTFGGNGSLQLSPLFGNAYQILNSTGSTISGATGMITQSAYQDYFQAPIINTTTQYGVRITAEKLSTSTDGALVVDLFSPSVNRTYGLFSVSLATLTESMVIYTGNLLTQQFFSNIPVDLQLRVYATGLDNGSGVLIDRLEPFDLSQPVLTTQLRGSYVDNFEAFDDVTGDLGFGTNNQQEIRCAFSLFDNLYVVKTGSMYSTTDNGVTEPDGWTVREISNKVGTPSIHGVDSGEGWAVIAGLAGIYVFDGGQPIKFSQEIDPVWQSINWTYGYTLWIRNDTNSRRLSIGVPLPTPNKWMPKFPVNANPTEPNVVLVCQYKELMTSSALAGEGPIRQSYLGTLKSYQLGRKWSAWSIEAGYADFITRQDTTEPLFYCGDTGTAKIYQQLTGNHLDDGEAILDQYVSYPFIKSDEAQQLQTGLHNLMAEFVTCLIVGEGALTPTIYPNTLDSPYATRLDPPFILENPPPYGDTEMPANVPGNRFFVGFETLTPGDWFKISRVVLNVKQDPWAPTRGSNGNN